METVPRDTHPSHPSSVKVPCRVTSFRAGVTRFSGEPAMLSARPNRPHAPFQSRQLLDPLLTPIKVYASFLQDTNSLRVYTIISASEGRRRMNGFTQIGDAFHVLRGQ